MLTQTGHQVLVPPIYLPPSTWAPTPHVRLHGLLYQRWAKVDTRLDTLVDSTLDTWSTDTLFSVGRPKGVGM